MKVTNKKIKIMKKNIIPWLLLSILPLLMISCLKEDFIPDPSLKSVSFYMTSIDGKDSLITQIKSGKTIKIIAKTDAEICSMWPGGVRTIRKMKGTTIDSLDMFNHPVLISSDCYSDYGLVGARGLKGTQTKGGWYVSYKYNTPGEFDLTIVLTNHGFKGPDYRKVVVPYGKVTVSQ
jgi:hypothetical protein